jgi:L-ascorbate metabolism protein UlaG (beta-lactamase superfamily)
MKKILCAMIIGISSLFAFSTTASAANTTENGSAGSSIKAPRTEKYVTKDGTQLVFHFYSHSSIAIEIQPTTTNNQKALGKTQVANKSFIYIDPVNRYGEFYKEPKAAAILITHSHPDHLDKVAIAELSKNMTIILSDRTSAESITGKQSDTNEGHMSIETIAVKSIGVSSLDREAGGKNSNSTENQEKATCMTMSPGQAATLSINKHGIAHIGMMTGAKSNDMMIKIEAVPAYNTTKGHLQFHPQARKDCGYIINIGGSRIYIAGDTENIPEMSNLKKIDVVFLPVNQPFTMTVEQAAAAVKTIRPKIFYPYHYGNQNGQASDMKELAKLTARYTTIKIMNME